MEHKKAHEPLLRMSKRGTALIGISKPVVKAHGSSNAACIFAAVRQAIDFADSGLIDDINANIEYMKIKVEEENGQA